MRDHDDTVIGLRQKGTDNWGYQDETGSLKFGPLSARTQFFDRADKSAYETQMGKAQGTLSIEPVAVRRRIEVLEPETVG